MIISSILTAENMVGFIIFAFVAAFMMGIGISQIRSKQPVGFYSGEKPPRAEDLTDVAAWNKKHGWMWMVYGVVILLSYFAGALFGDTIWSAVPMVSGVIVPLPFMILGHNKLRKRYMTKER